MLNLLKTEQLVIVTCPVFFSSMTFLRLALDLLRVVGAGADGRAPLAHVVLVAGAAVAALVAGHQGVEAERQAAYHVLGRNIHIVQSEANNSL